MAGFAWVYGLGWALAVGGGGLLVAWTVGRSARGVRRCPSCEYDMSGVTGLQCPECGRTAVNERRMLGRRRRRWWLAAGVVLTPLGVGALVLNPARRDGWASSVPQGVIWPLMPWFDGWTDGVVARVAGAPWTPLPTPGTNKWSRWDRLLIARRCGTLGDKVETLCRLTPEERMAADAATPAPVAAPAAPATTVVSGSGGAAAMPVIPNPYLISRATDPLARARNEITGLIALTESEAGLAAPAIGRAMRAAMEERDADTWWWAIRTLGQAKCVDAPTAELLLTLTKNEERSIRGAALGTLVECRRSLESGAVVNVLVAALDDTDSLTRRCAAAWLGSIGADARGAIPRLKEAALNDTDPWVRSSASGAIVMIEGGT